MSEGMKQIPTRETHPRYKSVTTEKLAGEYLNDEITKINPAELIGEEFEILDPESQKIRLTSALLLGVGVAIEQSKFDKSGKIAILGKLPKTPLKIYDPSASPENSPKDLEKRGDYLKSWSKLQEVLAYKKREDNNFTIGKIHIFFNELASPKEQEFVKKNIAQQLGITPKNLRVHTYNEPTDSLIVGKGSFFLTPVIHNLRELLPKKGAEIKEIPIKG